MARPTLNDRLREVKACCICRPTGGVWAADANGNARPGVRCDCPRGRLLAIGDAARHRRQALETAA